MIIGRMIGWLLVLAALVVLGRDVIAWHETGSFEPVVIGKLWYDLHPASLNLIQAVIQRYVIPGLWDPVIVTVLLWWAAPVLAVIGLLLVWLFRARRGRRRAR